MAQELCLNLRAKFILARDPKHRACSVSEGRSEKGAGFHCAGHTAFPFSVPFLPRCIMMCIQYNSTSRRYFIILFTVISVQFSFHLFICHIRSLSRKHIVFLVFSFPFGSMDCRHWASSLENLAIPFLGIEPLHYFGHFFHLLMLLMFLFLWRISDVGSSFRHRNRNTFYDLVPCHVSLYKTLCFMKPIHFRLLS